MPSTDAGLPVPTGEALEVLTDLVRALGARNRSTVGEDDLRLLLEVVS